MKAMQLLKDYGLLLNDSRIGSCDVRSDKNGGLYIGRVVFAQGNGNYVVLVRDLHLTYDTLLDCVRTVYRNHPTRGMTDVLYSVIFDTARGTFSMCATNCSNLELYGVKHRPVSGALRAELEHYIDKCDIRYVTSYCAKYVSAVDRAGGFTFTI